MPKKVGTTQWRKQRRKEYLEKKEYRYYIFCEGEQTEPLYFEGFKRLIEDKLGVCMIRTVSRQKILMVCRSGWTS